MHPFRLSINRILRNLLCTTTFATGVAGVLGREGTGLTAVGVGAMGIGGEGTEIG